MYCVKCGVKLCDSEKICPLCNARVLEHPDVDRQQQAGQYPKNRYPVYSVRPSGWLFIATSLFLLPLIITFICDFQINDRVSWSGYVIGALVTLYTMIVLPLWFKKPNPVIFVPVTFAVIGLYLMYISISTNGGWFLSFAFPIVSAVGFIVTAVVTLLRYVRKGYLYIFGGGFIAFGGFSLLLEYLLKITFNQPIHYWSLFPLAVLSAIGMLLIVIAICRPAKEAFERKFFF